MSYKDSNNEKSSSCFLLLLFFALCIFHLVAEDKLFEKYVLIPIILFFIWLFVLSYLLIFSVFPAFKEIILSSIKHDVNFNHDKEAKLNSKITDLYSNSFVAIVPLYFLSSLFESLGGWFIVLVVIVVFMVLMFLIIAIFIFFNTDFEFSNLQRMGFNQITGPLIVICFYSYFGWTIIQKMIVTLKIENNL